MIEEKLPISNALHSRVTRRLGYYPGAEVVRRTVQAYRGVEDVELLRRFAEVHGRFMAADGRGVELADELDAIRIVLAVRNVRPAKPVRDDQAIERIQREHAVFRGALESFVSTVEAVGGIIRGADGDAPVGDPEWIDLGDAYVAACAALGREPVIAPAEESDDG